MPAQPANQACIGKSYSALATTQPFPGAFGGGVRGFAQDPNTAPGLGDGVQAVQAGVVPDDVVPNTCNDPSCRSMVMRWPLSERRGPAFGSAPSSLQFTVLDC